MSALTADEVQRIIKDEWLTATANWYGPTGRSDRSAWIDRDGDEWVVWEADERAVHYNFRRYRSEAEALGTFLGLARGYKRRDSTAVRRI